MMKRNILAVVIPALLAAGAANAAEIYNKDGNKLDLYGKAVGLHYFSSDKSSDGDKSYARLGFKGETQINSELTGYGQWEYNFATNNSEDQGTKGNKTRLGFAGLKFADYGSFDYGRNYGVVYDVEGWTDMLPEFGGDTYTNTDNFMTQRATGVATYRNKNFFGLVDGWDFALQYQGKNDRSDVKTSNGDGVGVSTSYAIMDTGISLGAAYSSSNRTLDQKNKTTAGGNVADTWTLGAKYDANNVYFATMYAETRNMTPYGSGSNTIANKTQNYEVVAQYQFDFGLRPSIAYLQSKGKDLNTVYGNNKDLVKYVDIGATYYFNKNMSTYVDYKINLLNDNDSAFYNANGINTDNIVATGLVYQF
ncbi:MULTISPECIES: porin OmpC [unclassified Serratia (in: enterobacteria)]|uniref:porin OmpC n=1 Tax=unclassified Serratia (in: enterobacteria) TaxID=2647522 RepID=UPI0030762A54